MIELVTVVGVLIGVFYFVYWFLTKNNNYWKDRGIQYIEPKIFYGSIKDEVLNRGSWIDFSSKCYNKFKNCCYGGVFLLNSPALYVCDLKLIEKILVEDFSSFTDRWVEDDSNMNLSYSLTFSKGDEWRKTRLILSPAFGPAKVKGMFPQIFAAVERTMVQFIDNLAKEEPIDVEHFANVFVTDSISSCLFGVNMSDSYESFLLRKSLDEISSTTKNHPIVLILGMRYPKLLNCLLVLRDYRKTMNTYSNIVKDIITFRIQNKIRRNDILQVILDLFEGKKTQDQGAKKCLNYDKIQPENPSIFDIASSIMMNFLNGGIRPTASTITFALFEIARHPEVQKCVQEEIEHIKNQGWNVDALEHMNYLDQVIHETLRLYSFNTTIFRILTKPYNLPGTNVTLEEGMHVFVPINGIHRDPEFYPEPDEFRPERFKGHNYKPTSTFLPFGQGPRICVAIRLAVSMVKLCLARILAQYEVRVSSKMSLPLQLSSSEYYPRAEGGVWLEFHKRTATAAADTATGEFDVN